MPKSRRNGHKKGRTVATRHQGLPGGVRGREWVQNTAVKTLVCTPSPSSWLATPLSSRANRRVDSRGPQSRSASLCGGHPASDPAPRGRGRPRASAQPPSRACCCFRRCWLPPNRPSRACALHSAPTDRESVGGLGWGEGRLEGPLRWAVDLVGGVSVAIAGPLPPPA